MQGILARWDGGSIYQQFETQTMGISKDWSQADMSTLAGPLRGKPS